MNSMTFSNQVGWDTETWKGYPFLIGYYSLADDEYDYLFFEDVLQEKPYISHDDRLKMVDILTQRRFKNDYNSYFNIRFDTESILKFLLGESNDYMTKKRYHEIAYYGLTFFDHEGKIPIECIEKRTFSIKNNRYYDIFQFFNQSLNSACKRYLGMRKNTIDDVVNWNDLQSIKNNLGMIIDYFKQDCFLCAQLSKFFMDNWQELGYVFEKPVSMGTLAQINFKKRTGINRIYQLDKYADRILSSYVGGMFDIWKKGTHKHIWTYDINSAYPSVIKDLISLDNCKIHELHEFDEQYEYSYYCCNVEFRKPFKAIKINGKNYYMIGWHYGIWLTKNEILMIEYLQWPIEILNGIGIYTPDKSKPMFEEITETYRKRKTFPKESIFYYQLKIYPNSLYGKFKQDLKKTKVFKTFKQNEIEKAELYKKKLEHRGNEVFLHQFTGNMIGVIAHAQIHSGIYNPVYSTEITSIPRLVLLKKAYQNETDVVFFNTDSITFTKPVHSIPVSGKLGDFSLEIDDKIGTFLNTGIYCYRNDDLSFYKQRLRGGFDNKANDVKIEDTLNTLFNLLHTEKEYFDFVYKNMKHLKSALRSNIISELNIIKELPKKIFVDSSLKREWNRNLESGYGALEKFVSSKPYKTHEILEGENLLYQTIQI